MVWCFLCIVHTVMLYLLVGLLLLFGFIKVKNIICTQSSLSSIFVEQPVTVLIIFGTLMVFKHVESHMQNIL